MVAPRCSRRRNLSGPQGFGPQDREHLPTLPVRT